MNHETMFALGIVVVLILVGGLIYTYRIGKLSPVSQGDPDAEMSGKFRKHYLLLNPVFLAYIIGIGLVIIYLAYLASSTGW